MKNGFFALFLVFSFLAAKAAFAYNPATITPVPTSFAVVAMQFYKLTGQTPDFEAWVKIGKAYKTASPFDQKMILAREQKKLEELFKKTPPAAPIIVEAYVELSKYSIVNKGFLIESFGEDTFFSIDFNDEYYALVPDRVLDHQWMKVAEDEAQKIESAKVGGGRGVRMYVELIPKYADKTAPLLLGDRHYWLISAEIKKMMLFNRDEILWEERSNQGNDPRQKELMDLYR